MKIEEVMSADCKYVDETSTLVDAAKLMAAEDFGSVPVANGVKLTGMLTDRDIILRAVAKGLDPARCTAKETMSGEVYYCRKGDDVDGVAKNMADMQIRRMPVVDEDKNLCGFVSLGDLSVRGAQQAAGEALSGISQPN